MFILNFRRSNKSAEIKGKYHPKISTKLYSQDAYTSPSLLGECLNHLEGVMNKGRVVGKSGMMVGALSRESPPAT